MSASQLTPEPPAAATPDHPETHYNTIQPAIQGITIQPEDPEPDRLLHQLEIYQNLLLLTSFGADVQRTRTIRVISPDDLAQALLADLALASPVLPEGAIAWKKTRRGPCYYLWRPPRIWRAKLQLQWDQPAEEYRLPMPGLIFGCTPGQPPSVHAALQRPLNLEERIYHAPVWNLFNNGQSCPGSHIYPQQPAQIPESFFESRFSTHNSIARSREHGQDLGALWRSLNGRRKYPNSDLLPCGALAEISNSPN